MKNIAKKLLILSCFASLAHCQMGYAGYFGSWGSYLANSSIVKTATDVSTSLFDIVCEHPYATAAIGVSAALGSLSAYALINKRKIQREQERIHNLPHVYVNLPEQINGSEPEDDFNDLSVIILRKKMVELGLLNEEEFMSLPKLHEGIVVQRIPQLEHVLIETSDASEDKKREFFIWFNERVRNSNARINNL